MANQCGDYSLECRTCRDKHAKWQRSIEAIRREVAWLVHDHLVFRTTVGIMEQAQVQELDRTFYAWVGHTYQEAVSLRVRRLLDQDDRTHSLRLLLSDISENYKVLSRERFINLYPADIPALRESVAASKFDELAGVGADSFPGERATSDLDEMLGLASRLKQTTDKRFAHYDKTPPTDAPTWGEVDRCVGQLSDLTRRYRFLLDATNRDVGHEPPKGWTSVFAFAWKPEEPGRGTEQ